MSRCLSILIRLDFNLIPSLFARPVGARIQAGDLEDLRRVGIGIKYVFTVEFNTPSAVLDLVSKSSSMKLTADLLGVK
jgi:hypothetical protein